LWDRTFRCLQEAEELRSRGAEEMIFD